MKLLLLLLYVFLLCSIAFSQTQIDSLVNVKKNYDQTKQFLIYEYRLPSFGYDQFWIDFDGSLLNSFNSLDKNSQSKDQSRINISPEYSSYYESENCIFSLNTLINSSYFKTMQKDKEENWQQDRENRRIGFNVSLNGKLQKYQNKMYYLKISSLQSFQYYESSDHFTKKDENKLLKGKSLYINRANHSEFRIGIGRGRVRNVVPLFRALGFNELYKTATNSSGFALAELKELAEFFTKRNSYYQVFDRPEKYFYEKFPQNILAKIKKLSPWQLIYLNDTWRQIIGSRYEGFSLDGGILISYDKKNYSTDYYDSELFLFGVYLDQNYYHNVSLNYQIGLNVYSSFSKPLNRNTSYKYFGKGKIDVTNLINLLDQLLLQFKVGFQTAFVSSRSQKLPVTNAWQRLDDLKALLSFDYFIENNLSFNANILYNLRLNNPEDIYFYYDHENYYNSDYRKSTYFNINFGLRYYFKRGLY